MDITETELKKTKKKEPKLDADGNEIRNRKKKEKKAKVDTDADVDGDEEIPSSSGAGGSKGLNWAAIGFLLLFIGPAVLTGAIMVDDWMHPTAASERAIKKRITPCIEAANPKRVQDIDDFAKKYAGKESVIYNKLRRKYDTIEECQRI